MEYVIENNLLDDHCVLEILSFLTLQDLYQTMNVSKQFRRLTFSTFREKYKNFRLAKHFYIIDMYQLTQFFTTFGHLIQSLDTDPIFYPWYHSCLQKSTIELIRRYCREDQLRSLKMSYFNSIYFSFAKLTGIFRNLQTINIECVSLPYSISNFLNLLTNAKEIILNRCIEICAPTPETRIEMSILQVEKLHLNCFDRLNVLSLLPVIHICCPKITDLMFRVVLDRSKRRFAGFNC